MKHRDGEGMVETIWVGEIWKPVVGHECRYKVSNLGRVKRISRTVINTSGVKATMTERFLSLFLDADGYYQCNLTNDFSERKLHKIHNLVADAFIEEIRGCRMVNHKDSNRANNRIDNLEFVSKRENSTHGKGSKDIHTGCSLHKKSGLWISRIGINGKKKYLGYYKTELEASAAYKKALEEFGLENRYAR